MAQIKHVCAFSFRDGVEASDRESLLLELEGLPIKFPKMRNWICQKNISRRDDRFSHAFIIEVDSESDLLEYLNCEAHERFVKEKFRPTIRERAIVTLPVEPIDWRDPSLRS